MKISNVAPGYPAEARAARLHGRTRVVGLISTDGTMTELTVVDATHSSFGAAALDAVRQWRFDPMYLNCVPVPTRLEVVTNFIKP